MVANRNEPPPAPFGVFRLRTSNVCHIDVTVTRETVERESAWAKAYGEGPNAAQRVASLVVRTAADAWLAAQPPAFRAVTVKFSWAHERRPRAGQPGHFSDGFGHPNLSVYV